MIVDMFVFRIYCFSFYCIPSAVAMWLCFSCGKSVVDIYCERYGCHVCCWGRHIKCDYCKIAVHPNATVLVLVLVKSMSRYET